MHTTIQILITILVAAATSFLTFLLQERKLRVELRTEFMAETAIRRLLMCPKWKKRSVEEIEKRLGGFERNELGRLLVRAGAVRFKGPDEKELWGLIERNEDDL